MKKVICTLMAVMFIFIFSFEVSASGFTIDGKIGAAEWNGVEAEDFIKSSSGCNIKNFIYQYIVDEKNDRVIFAFRTIEKGEMENFENCAFEIVVDGESSILVTSNYEEFDSEYFNVDSAVILSGNQMVSSEISILFKKGIGKNISFAISAYDSFGNSSRDYYLNFSFSESEEISSENSSEQKMVRVKTTKEKTTKEKTKKEKTTKEKTTKSKNKSSSKSSKYITVKASKKSSKISADSDDEYETVEENDYYEDEPDNVEAVNQDEDEEQNNDSAIVLKTLAVTIAVLALGSIAFTVKKNKKI